MNHALLVLCPGWAQRHVGSLQPDDFADPQAGPHTEVDCRSIVLWHGLAQRGQLPQGRHARLLGPAILTSSLELAGVGRDEVIGESGFQNRLEKAVGVRHRPRLRLVQPPVPLPDSNRRDVGEKGAAPAGQEMPVQQRPIEVSSAGREGTLLEPRLGVLAEGPRASLRFGAHHRLALGRLPGPGVDVHADPRQRALRFSLGLERCRATLRECRVLPSVWPRVSSLEASGATLSDAPERCASPLTIAAPGVLSHGFDPSGGQSGQILARCYGRSGSVAVPRGHHFPLYCKGKATSGQFARADFRPEN
jgi:hypothetical protein